MTGPPRRDSKKGEPKKKKQNRSIHGQRNTHRHKGKPVEPLDNPVEEIFDDGEHTTHAGKHSPAQKSPASAASLKPTGRQMWAANIDKQPDREVECLDPDFGITNENKTRSRVAYKAVGEVTRGYEVKYRERLSYILDESSTEPGTPCLDGYNEALRNYQEHAVKALANWSAAAGSGEWQGLTEEECQKSVDFVDTLLAKGTTVASNTLFTLIRRPMDPVLSKFYMGRWTFTDMNCYLGFERAAKDYVVKNGIVHVAPPEKFASTEEPWLSNVHNAENRARGGMKASSGEGRKLARLHSFGMFGTVTNGYIDAERTQYMLIHQTFSEELAGALVKDRNQQSLKTFGIELQAWMTVHWPRMAAKIIEEIPDLDSGRKPGMKLMLTSMQVDDLALNFRYNKTTMQRALERQHYSFEKPKHLEKGQIDEEWPGVKITGAKLSAFQKEFQKAVAGAAKYLCEVKIARMCKKMGNENF